MSSPNGKPGAAAKGKTAVGKNNLRRVIYFRDQAEVTDAEAAAQRDERSFSDFGRRVILERARGKQASR